MRDYEMYLTWFKAQPIAFKIGCPLTVIVIIIYGILKMAGGL